LSSIKIQFEEKSKDVLIWNGQVVMSRTEEKYFEAIFSRLSYLKPSKVMEVGFGLGISAALIQKYFKPAHHDIFEIEEGIYADLKEFSEKQNGVRPFLGDWQSIPNEERYDFIFYDPFDYVHQGQIRPHRPDEKAVRMKQLLKPSGVLSHPHFGDGNVPDVKGFDTVVFERMKVTPIRMADETYCEDVAIVYHLPQNRIRGH
jgi:SAM-dependent methyltransferase